MEINHLFPTPVAFTKLDRAITAEELEFVKNQEKRPNMGNVTTKTSQILNEPVLADIRKFIEVSVEEYFKKVYAPKHEVSLKFTQSWCNYTEKGQFHHKHAHPNSFISGVFYPQANKQKDKIVFYRDGYQQIKIKTDDWNTWNSESWWFNVGSGDLILFPSGLTHMVETVESDELRISLSFNTFPEGYLGDSDELTALYGRSVYLHDSK